MELQWTCRRQMKWKRNKNEIETRAKWQLLTTAKKRSDAHSVHLLTPKSEFLPTISALNQTYCHENKANDHQLKKLLIAKQIFHVNILGDVERTVSRKFILMLECKKVNCHHLRMLLKINFNQCNHFQVVKFYKMTWQFHQWQQLPHEDLRYV